MMKLFGSRGHCVGQIDAFDGRWDRLDVATDLVPACGSNVSSWLGPPCSQIINSDLGGDDFSSAMANFSAR